MNTLPESLVTVTLEICGLCLTGVGDVCDTPGCALWMCTVPDAGQAEAIRARTETAAEAAAEAECAGLEPGDEHCPDCGCDPDNHTLHVDGCRRCCQPVELQCGPPWNPWPGETTSSTEEPPAS
jgi:hypothetical protein